MTFNFDILKRVLFIFIFFEVVFSSFNVNAKDNENNLLQVFQIVSDRTVPVLNQNVVNDLYLNSNSSSISYKILSGSGGNKQKIQYQLSGLDHDWHQLNDESIIITYPFLSPGHYQFQVKITNKDSLTDIIYKANSLWVVSSWGKASYWLVASAIIMLLCFIILDAEFLRKIILRYKNRSEVSVNENSENSIK